MVIGEKNETDLVALFTQSLTTGTTVNTLYIDHEQDEALYNETICTFINSGSFAAMVDMSWGGWEDAQNIAKTINMPYIRVEVLLFDIVRRAPKARSRALYYM